MSEKLKSALKTPLLPLTFRAAIFAGFLVWMKFGGGPKFIPVFLFILTAGVFYFRPPLNYRRLLPSFLILLTLSLIFASSWPIAHGQWLAVVFVAGFSAAFYLILGVKNLLFVKRPPFYFLLNNILLLFIFLFFFSGSPEFSIPKYLLLSAAILLLTKELFGFLMPESPGRRLIFAASFTFLTIQFVWAAFLLPIGFLNLAALALPFVFILGDFAGHHLSGSLNRRIILRNITILTIAAIIIFAASKWSL